MARTAACVDITVSDNATVQDAFQFGTPGDTSWSLTGMSFIMEVKQELEDLLPSLTFQTADNSIIVDDVVQRVIHLNLPDNVLRAALPPATYVYDLIMFDGSTPPIRTQMMKGRFTVEHGTTED